MAVLAPDGRAFDGPVADVLFHGSGFNRLQFLLARPLLLRSLRRRLPGLRVQVVAWDNEEFLGSDGASIKQLAERVLPDLLGTTGVRKWVFVGHSLGGLVAAELCSRVSPVALVTLGTPWQGAPLLRFKRCRRLPRHEEMAPDSETLAELRRQASNRPLKVLCLGSRSDVLVGGDSWVLKGHGRAEWPWLGHYSMLAWPGVWLAVAQFVASELAVDAPRSAAGIGLEFKALHGREVEHVTLPESDP